MSLEAAGTANGFPLALLPNPTTPLAFIPQDIADTLQLAIYFSVGTTAMFIWDILVNVPKDWKLLFEHKVTFPTIVYFLSRLFSLGCLLSETILLTARLSDCQSPVHILEAMFFAGMAATNLLFFFRIRAIYNRNPWIVAAFFFLWLANVGCSSTEFLLGEGFHIGPTRYCVILNVRVFYAVIPAVAVLVHDTIIFAAVSARLYTHSQVVNRRSESFTTSAKDYISGRRLPKFSRALFVDGQVYYLISFLTTAVVITMLLIPSLPVAYHLMMIPPHIAIVNSMACSVYRNVRFGIIKEGAISTTSVTSYSAPARPGISLLPIHHTQNPVFNYRLSHTGDPKPGSSISLTSPTSKCGPELA